MEHTSKRSRSDTSQPIESASTSNDNTESKQKAAKTKSNDASLKCGCISGEKVIKIADYAEDFVVSREMLSEAGTWIKTSTHNGVKVIVKKSNALTGMKRESLEAKAMKAVCGHPNIAQLYGDAIVQDGSIASLQVGFRVPKQHLMMVMEYLTPSYGGTDKPNLYSRDNCKVNNLSVTTIFSHICKHIGAAMHHLYECHFLHRDIKLRNTAFEIVNGDIVFKLIDFGSAIHNVPRRELGWQVDKDSFREMIMSIFFVGHRSHRSRRVCCLVSLGLCR